MDDSLRASSGEVDGAFFYSANSGSSRAYSSSNVIATPALAPLFPETDVVLLYSFLLLLSVKTLHFHSLLTVFVITATDHASPERRQAVKRKMRRAAYTLTHALVAERRQRDDGQ
jgi:hypothetical protein